MYHLKPSVKPELRNIDYKVEARPLTITGEHTHGVSFDRYAIVRLDVVKPGKAGKKKTPPVYEMRVLNPSISKPESGHQIVDPSVVVEGLIKQFKGLRPVRYTSSQSGDQFAVLLGRVGEKTLNGEKSLVVKTIRPDSRNNYTPIRYNKGKILCNFYLLYIHRYNNAEKNGFYFIEVELLYSNMQGEQDRHVFHIPTEADCYLETIERFFNFTKKLSGMSTKQGYGKAIDGYKRAVRYTYTGAYSEGALANTHKEKAKEKMAFILYCERLFKALYGDTMLSAFFGWTRYYDLHLTANENHYFKYFFKSRDGWIEGRELLEPFVKWPVM